MDWVYSKTYNEKTYNCAHFVIEVWKTCLGLEVSALQGFLTGRWDRKVCPQGLRGFERLKEPESWCMCLFQGPAHSLHVGIYLRNRVLHLSKTGVHWVGLEVVMIEFTKVRFYGVKNFNHS